MLTKKTIFCNILNLYTLVSLTCRKWWSQDFCFVGSKYFETTQQ